VHGLLASAVKLTARNQHCYNSSFQLIQTSPQERIFLVASEKQLFSNCNQTKC